MQVSAADACQWEREWEWQWEWERSSRSAESARRGVAAAAEAELEKAGTRTVPQCAEDGECESEVSIAAAVE